MLTDRRTRVTFVNPCADISGAEMSLLLLLSGLSQGPYDLTVVAPEEGDFTHRARSIGAEVRTFPMHAMMIERNIAASIKDAVAAAKDLGQIRRFLEHQQPDLLHINSYRVGIPFSLSARQLSIPSVWHIRDIPQSVLKRRLLRMLVGIPNHSIAISQAVAKAISDGGRPALSVVYNGVELDKYTTVSSGQLRRELALEEKTLLFCSIGQLIPWKGHRLLISAFRSVMDKTDKPMHLAIIGSTVNPVWSVSEEYHSYPAHLKRLVSELGLESHVTFLGFRENIPDLLLDVDLLVHTPTAPEPFGRVLVEAMAAAKPVIASNGGGIPEIVEDGNTGLLFRAGDINSLIDALMFGIENLPLLKEMGQRGRARAKRYFSASEHVGRMEQLFSDVIRSQKSTLR